MRTETYKQSTGRLLEITELTRDAQLKAKYRRQNPPGTVVEDRDATAAEAQVLTEEERLTKREEARVRAMTAIKAQSGQSPWGMILKDLAIAQGWIED